MIHLYTWPTPNGHKVQIMLEEVGLPYVVHPVDITRGAQFDPTYLSLNPNNKVPTIVDDEGPDGKPLTIFETGAILIHLAEKTGQFMPAEPRARSEVLQWLMWQMGGLGPMLGQAQHFHRYASEKVPYAIERYAKEGRRLLSVMERRLVGRDYLAGDYSIADIACFPWVRIHKMANQSLDDLPLVSRWYAAVRARPAVQRGLKVLLDQWVDVTKSEQARTNLFGDPQYRSTRNRTDAPGFEMTTTVTLYVDYRSPFSYLVKDEAHALARDFGVELVWRPFAIDLEGAYGGAVGERTERDWREVRYLYMDARRLASPRGLIVLGPQKIYDPTIAHVGMLQAQQAGDAVFRRYHDAVCERFWRRELDIEDAAAVRTILVHAGADGHAFDELIESGEGARRCRAITAEGEERGVFGVPTFVLDGSGELFWGTDRIWMLRERLGEKLRQELGFASHEGGKHGLVDRTTR